MVPSEQPTSKREPSNELSTTRHGLLKPLKVEIAFPLAVENTFAIFLLEPPARI